MALPLHLRGLAVLTCGAMIWLLWSLFRPVQPLAPPGVRMEETMRDPNLDCEGLEYWREASIDAKQ